jgi:hypothetical protein
MPEDELEHIKSSWRSYGWRVGTCEDSPLWNTPPRQVPYYADLLSLLPSPSEFWSSMCELCRTQREKEKVACAERYEEESVTRCAWLSVAGSGIEGEVDHAEVDAGGYLSSGERPRAMSTISSLHS